MNDPTAIGSIPLLPQSWSGYLLTALVGLCLWIARGMKSDMKELAIAQGKFMTREEVVALLLAAENRARDADERQAKQHEQNTDNFREVRLQLESANTKLFDLALAKDPK